MVEKAVHGGGRQEGVAEEGVPLGEVAVGGEDGGAALVALPNDLIQIEWFLVLEGSQSQVIDDQQTRRCEAEQLTIVRAVASGCSERGEHLVGRNVQAGVPSTAGPMADRLG